MAALRAKLYCCNVYRRIQRKTPRGSTSIPSHSSRGRMIGAASRGDYSRSGPESASFVCAGICAGLCARGGVSRISRISRPQAWTIRAWQTRQSSVCPLLCMAHLKRATDCSMLPSSERVGTKETCIDWGLRPANRPMPSATAIAWHSTNDAMR